MAKLIKGEWSSRYAFILTCIGSNISMTSIWRTILFYKLHGFEYVILYLINSLFIGTSLLLLELSIGQRTKSGVIKCIKAIDKNLGIIGILILMANFLTLSNNIVIAVWTLYLIFYSFFIPIPWVKDKVFFITDVLKIQNNESIAFSYKLIPGLIIILIISYILTLKNYRYLETYNKVFLPIAFVLSSALIIYCFTFQNKIIFLKLIQIDIKRFADIQIWAQTIIQIMVSNNIGTGTNIILSSYLSTYQNTVIDSIIIVIIKLIFEIICFLLCGLILIESEFEKSYRHESVFQLKEFDMMFISIPLVLSKSKIFTILFFVTILIIGIGSIPPKLLCLFKEIDQSRKNKKIKRYLILSVLFFYSLLLIFNFGTIILQCITIALDYYLCPLVLLLETIAIGWIFEINNVIKNIGNKSYYILLIGYFISTIVSNVIYVFLKHFWLNLLIFIPSILIFLLISYYQSKNTKDLSKITYILFGNAELYRFERNIIYRSNIKIRIPMAWPLIIRYILPYFLILAIIHHNDNLFKSHLMINEWVKYIYIFVYSIPVLVIFFYLFIKKFKFNFYRLKF